MVQWHDALADKVSKKSKISQMSRGEEHCCSKSVCPISPLRKNHHTYGASDVPIYRLTHSDIDEHRLTDKLRLTDRDWVRNKGLTNKPKCEIFDAMRGHDLYWVKKNPRT